MVNSDDFMFPHNVIPVPAATDVQLEATAFESPDDSGTIVVDSRTLINAPLHPSARRSVPMPTAPAAKTLGPRRASSAAPGKCAWFADPNLPRLPPADPSRPRPRHRFDQREAIERNLSGDTTPEDQEKDTDDDDEASR